MKIYDCFMYIDEDIILDLRLNCLNEFVDRFVIAEAKFTHSGKKRNLLFDIKKFKKFENKITYLILNQEPHGIEIVNNHDNKNEKTYKYILNGYKRDNYQRNYLNRGIQDAEPNDIIMIFRHTPLPP